MRKRENESEKEKEGEEEGDEWVVSCVVLRE
jgi:hypothetical protein